MEQAGDKQLAAPQLSCFFAANLRILPLLSIRPPSTRRTGEMRVCVTWSHKVSAAGKE
jgi:hypothetical protein